MRSTFLFGLCLICTTLSAQDYRVFSTGQIPKDERLGDLKNLNGYFPFQQVQGVEQWNERHAEIRRRILVSQGLWPRPPKTPLNAVVHGRVERDDYVVDRVFFESIPGHFVTGSLYRPRQISGKCPAILSPHGHWSQGRFYDAGDAHVQNDIKIGAETFKVSGRFPIQARAVQLARMGCLVFVYDMTGNADSIQIKHRPDKWSHLDRKDDWGFMSVQAELRLQNMMGLQTWNSIRAVDFLLSLDEVDPNRIGVTGASGGGTQSMIIGAIDDRIAAAMPCVMVSTAMQGGCTCENAPLLRIDQGNIDIAAAVAPRPLGLTAADDWTIELESKGYPDLVKLYEMLGHPNRLTAVFHTRFKHNYNQVNRNAMYQFFNHHFDLGYSEPIVERDFQPLSRSEATVWIEPYPAPSNDAVGDTHEVNLLRMITSDSERLIDSLIPNSAGDLDEFLRVLGGGWETILGRRLDQVGLVDFDITVSHSLARGAKLTLGALKHQGEQIPVYQVRAQGEHDSQGTVIWITDTGKRAILRDNDKDLIEPVAQLLEQGFDVLAADLIGQGEFLSKGDSSDTQPMWYQRGGDSGWHRFAGYTYGYNHPRFVQRVHDVLTLIKLAKSRPGKVHLVGLGGIAGPLVIAARSQAGESVDHTFVDTREFHFANLERHDDVRFVPGAVKYLGLDGLAALCVPSKLSLAGSSPGDAAARVYAAVGASDALKMGQDRRSFVSDIVNTLSPGQ